MDKILLNGVRLDVHLGVPVDERALLQTVVVDVECEYDTRPAGLADDFSQTLDYAAIHEAVRRTAASRPYALVEALAESIASTVLDQFNVAGVRIRLRKPAALAAKGVNWAGVEIHRIRNRG